MYTKTYSLIRIALYGSSKRVEIFANLCGNFARRVWLNDASYDCEFKTALGVAGRGDRNRSEILLIMPADDNGCAGSEPFGVIV